MAQPLIQLLNLSPQVLDLGPQVIGLCRTALEAAIRSLLDGGRGEKMYYSQRRQTDISTFGTDIKTF